MVKKLLLLILVSAGSMFCLAAQIRSYVCIVREHYYPNTVKMLEEYRDRLKENGYPSYATSIDGYLKGGFGSGFVFVAKDGSNYIVTNRHVVSQAETASIEFEGENGAAITYDNLKILNTDEDLDLAVLAFPDNNKPFAKGLAFASRKITDGEDVWSAGYPGFGDKPLWQLGKGTVTNAQVRSKEIMDPSLSTVIQHSAQIDPGNSGGPLMIKDDTAPGGYSVIGINTWKAAYRQETNFAIPAVTVSMYVDRVLGNGKMKGGVLPDQVNSLLAILGSSDGDFTQLVKYVAGEYVGSDGLDGFITILRTAPTAVRNTIVDEFNYESPIEGMQYALAWKLWQKLHTDSRPSLTADTGTAVNGTSLPVKIHDSVSGITVETTWTVAHGSWKIASCSGPDMKSKDGSLSRTKHAAGGGFLFEAPYTEELSFYYGIPQAGSGTVSGDFGISRIWYSTSSEYPCLGFMLFLQTDMLTCLHTSSSAFNTESYSDDRRVIPGAGLKYRLPMTVSNLYIAPYAAVKAGYNTDSFIDSYSNTIVTGETGIQLGINPDADFNVFGGIAFEYEHNNLSSAEADKTDIPRIVCSLTCAFN